MNPMAVTAAHLARAYRLPVRTRPQRASATRPPGPAPAQVRDAPLPRRERQARWPEVPSPDTPGSPLADPALVAAVGQGDAPPAAATVRGRRAAWHAPEGTWEHLRGDPQGLIAACTPLVLSAGAKVCGRFLRPGSDEEVVIGQAAVFEASRAYRPESGVPFSAFATMVVRRRLIDHYRRTTRHREVPLSALEREDDEGGTWSPPEVTAALEADAQAREARERREDLTEFAGLLEHHGLSLRDLVRQSPRHRDARQRAVAVARALVAEPRQAAALRAHGRLPAADIERAGRVVGLSRKTVERRRRYILGIALLLAAGFPRLQAYLPGSSAVLVGPSV